MDPKAVAEAMDYIIEQLMFAQQEIPLSKDVENYELSILRTFAALGQAFGAAKAVKLQCEQAGKPKTRGAGE